MDPAGRAPTTTGPDLTLARRPESRVVPRLRGAGPVRHNSCRYLGWYLETVRERRSKTGHRRWRCERSTHQGGTLPTRVDRRHRGRPPRLRRRRRQPGPRRRLASGRRQAQRRRDGSMPRVPAGAGPNRHCYRRRASSNTRPSRCAAGGCAGGDGQRREGLASNTASPILRESGASSSLSGQRGRFRHWQSAEQVVYWRRARFSDWPVRRGA